MEIQLRPNIYLTDSTSFRSRSIVVCAWSGKSIGGPHIRIEDPNRDDEDYVATINLYNVEPLAQSLRDYNPSENPSGIEIGPSVIFYLSGATSNGICPICEDEYVEGEAVYQIDLIRVHAGCKDELVRILSEEVWEQSGEILANKFD